MRQRMINLSLVPVLLLLSGFNRNSVDNYSKVLEQNSICQIENTSFQAGEEITYKLYYNWNFVWLSAGEVTFKTTEKDGMYHISVAGDTYSSYEWFFKVRDRYDTWIDKSTLLPRISIRDIEEGSFKLYDKVVFDQNIQKAVSYRGNNAKDAKPKEILLNDCMHDMISTIYYARNVDYSKMKKGSAFPIKVFLDQQVYPLKMSYKGVEKGKKIKDNGKYDVIKFSPEVVKGDIYKEGDEVNVWVTNDPNRLPLLIESPVSIGSVKAVLKSYKNLKYPITSKIE